MFGLDFHKKQELEHVTQFFYNSRAGFFPDRFGPCREEQESGVIKTPFFFVEMNQTDDKVCFTGC